MLKFKNGRFYPELAPERLAFSIPEGFILDTHPDVINLYGFTIWMPDVDVEICAFLDEMVEADTAASIRKTYEKKGLKIESFSYHGFSGHWCMEQVRGVTSAFLLLNVDSLGMVDEEDIHYNIVGFDITIHASAKDRFAVDEHSLTTLLDQILIIE